MLAPSDARTFDGQNLSAAAERRRIAQGRVHEVLAPFPRDDPTHSDEPAVRGVKQGSPEFHAMVEAAVERRQHPIVVGVPIAESGKGKT